MSTSTDESKQPRVIHDVWDAILNDSWQWICVWGKPRVGKSTVCMQVAFQVYHDWDQVLQSFVFNLAGLLYKVDHGEPCRIMARNKLHNRVPILLWDDAGGMSNKAITRTQAGFDVFKGAIDVYATKVAVIMCSMGNPASLTAQLQSKYTAEVYVSSKGHAKYDTVSWMQDFRGWTPRQNKDWLDSFEFFQVPTDVYRQYDEMRMSLVDELNQLVKDSMVEDQTQRIIKRLQPVDVEFMELLFTRGMLHSDQLEKPENAKYREALIRCKARSLAVPVRRGSQYWYDLSDMGYEIVRVLREEGSDKQGVKPASEQQPVETRQP